MKLKKLRTLFVVGLSLTMLVAAAFLSSCGDGHTPASVDSSTSSGTRTTTVVSGS